jgi:hypothetical protein
MNQIMTVKPCLQPSAEVLSQRVQRLFGNVLGRSGFEMNHSGVLMDLDDVGHVGPVTARKDINLQPTLA